MGTNYRAKPLISGNVNPDIRICGMFTVNTSTAAIGTITRPSAGSAAAAGSGELWTASVATAGSFLWKVVLAEQYFAPVWVDARYNLVPTAANAGTATTFPTVPATTLRNNAATVTLGIAATAVDVPISTGATVAGSNSFYIYLYDGTSGAVPSSALTAPTGYNLMIAFEACFKNSVSPATL